MIRDPMVCPVERLELSFAPKPWDFAIERRTEIDAFFAKLQREKPAIWNGSVLLLHKQVVSGGVLRGEFLQTDYASYAAWCHWDWPPAAAHDCFAAAAIISSDGAFLLGEMAAHTFNAGQIYFPCGTPDLGDIVEGRVDLEASVRRELKEETGLDVGEFEAEPGWTMVADGALLALIKVLRSRHDATSLRARIVAQLARERQPELADIRIVRGPSDFVPAMRRFVVAFLAQHFAGG